MMFRAVKKGKSKGFLGLLMKRISAVLALVLLLLVGGGNFLSAIAAQEGSFGTRDSVSVEISFSLEVLGEDVPESDFRIYLERDVESPNAPLPEPFYRDVRKGAGKEEFHFTKMKFSREGVYCYRIKQEKKNQDGFCYDEAEYELAIEVLRANIDRYGNTVSPYLYAVVIGKKRGETNNALQLSFVNFYQKEKKGKVSFLPKEGKRSEAQGAFNRTAKKEGGEEGDPINTMMGTLGRRLRIIRRKLKGEGSKMALYAIATALATGNVIIWLYRMRFSGSQDSASKDSRKKEK